MEYEGSASGAPNPGVVDVNGNATLGGMIGAALGTLGQVAIDALNILSQTLGIPAANASSYSVVTQYGTVGYLTLPGMTPGMNLAQALAARGAKMDISGRVYDEGGTHAGFVDMNSTADAKATIGPINADIMTQTVSTATPGGSFAGVQIPADIGAQLTSIDGIVLQPITRYWKPWVSSSLGVPVMDYPNLVKMFSSTTRAFLRPAFVGGRDGIYSLHTGRRVVPPEGPGHPAPAGFQIGATADFAVANVMVGWTSGCYPFLWGYYGGDWWQALDPSTNAAPVMAFYARAKVWNGSQQISMDGYPGWDYTAAIPPNSTYPQFNTHVARIIAWSNVARNAVIATYTPGRDPGGPDGGPA